ncbi:MAG: hypothetical protein HUU08_09430 [Candidatus Brocadia sp.]|nr:hypothetical protein [Candidatus Brocadia sp.]UJS17503.1 MAG: hypothetical protein L3J17_00180 [Candidatus Jettenia sp.]
MVKRKNNRLKLISLTLKDSLARYRVTLSDTSLGVVASDLMKSLGNCDRGCALDCKDGCIDECKDTRKG